MTSDPITDVLRLADVQSVVSGGFTAGGAWVVQFPPPDKLKFFANVRGGCWLRLDDEAEATHIECGDVVLLAVECGFIMGSDLTATPRLAHDVFAGRSTNIVAVNDGDDMLQIGGHVRLHPAFAPMMSAALPRLIHVRASSPQAAPIRWLLDRMTEECAVDLPGSGAAKAQLAHLLFVHILRAYLASGEVMPAGWLRAAADTRLAPVLRMIHAEPGRAWRLDDLARAAAMSRTIFAAHFKSLAGVAPLTYVAEWRMRLAQDALRRDSVPVAVLARDLGYSSESAFSHAFKRVVGVSPSRYAGSLLH